MKKNSLKSISVRGGGGGGGDSSKKIGNELKELGGSLKRKSILEHLETKLSSTDTKTFIYRMTAVGEHEELPDELMKFKEALISGINSACYDEPATGVFALYPNNFLHVLEGSEDTLNKYIMACANEFEKEIKKSNEFEKKWRVKMKILNFMRVNTRSTDKWSPMIGNLTGGMDVITKVRGFRNRLLEFVKGSWILSSVFTTYTQPDDVSPPQDITDFPDPDDQVLVSQAAKDIILDLEEELNKYFPTVENLKYFMKPKPRLPPLRSPKEHMNHSWNLPRIIFGSETQWPIPCRLAPYN